MTANMTVIATLRERNQTLCYELEAVEAALNAASVPLLLEPFRERLRELIAECRGTVEQNLSDLSLDLAVFDEEVVASLLSSTKEAVQQTQLLSRQLTAPILRAKLEDALCLKIIAWIHANHPDVAHFPAAFREGDPAVYPLTDQVPVYFFPCLDSRGLLMQPLSFHELGHVLYELHRREMDDLVEELQGRIEDALRPLSHRSGPGERSDANRRRAIVETWYEWAQELYCDAVGLIMGGPAFLFAFCAYCGSFDTSCFYQEAETLYWSSHPVDWLRVQLLIRRARNLGLHEAADRVAREWNAVADGLGVPVDFQGFYDARFADDVAEILEDMLTETSPIRFAEADVIADEEWQPSDSPVLLLNRAWQHKYSDPAGYKAWEQTAIRAFLSTT
jgi:hypothetical protein